MDSKFGYPDLSPSAPSPQYQQLPPPPPYSSAENYSVQASPYPGGPSQSQPPSYPPPPPGMASSPMLVTVGPAGFGAYPQNMLCPSCNQTVITTTNHKAGILTWLASAGCCLIGCFLGCCLIPCCTDFTRDVEHSCSKCGRKLGLHRRI
ncbi:lipopolysaccharide-induced tumor necrosis factor-alpha factor homolog [Panonychus citri]|uniref:lipopolysaccharide-induced tumor necrosis factor-alpha factor homolog n=1 Tax=Panonychus citri TaxID=50023 RepID=UPI002306F4FE|nr:lipopolysaccharide-induced tumor necrosis factor-alpha factor homolog [Panonychus citri]